MAGEQQGDFGAPTLTESPTSPDQKPKPTEAPKKPSAEAAVTSLVLPNEEVRFLWLREINYRGLRVIYKPNMPWQKSKGWPEGTGSTRDGEIEIGTAGLTTENEIRLITLHELGHHYRDGKDTSFPEVARYATDLAEELDANLWVARNAKRHGVDLADAPHIIHRNTLNAIPSYIAEYPELAKLLPSMKPEAGIAPQLRSAPTLTEQPPVSAKASLLTRIKSLFQQRGKD